MSPTALLGLLAGAGLAGALVLLIAAWNGWQPKPRSRARRSATSLWGSAAGKRALAAIAAAVLVLVLSRWPVAAGATGALIYLWPTMFGGGRAAAAGIERLEALAVWTESLRDSMAAAVGLEDAIRNSVKSAPKVLVPALERLDGQMRARVPLTHALARFAEEFDDSSADLVVAALILNANLRGQGLVSTLTSLATSARDEVIMRRSVEEGRKSLRRTAIAIVFITGGFAAGLLLIGREYLAPYGNAMGQVMLGVVLCIFAIGLMWIRAAANTRPPERFLVSVDQIDQALRPSGGAR